MDDFRIYSAGKVWHAEKFRKLRDEKKVNITANWIDFGPQAFGDPRVWEHCLRDIVRCDYLVLYCEPEDKLVGALVEIGHAIALGKPVYRIGKCNMLKPSANSDVAVTHHKLWHNTPGNCDLEGGFDWASRHYYGSYGPSEWDDLRLGIN
jgi:nucleoside 2-deoxyribosyltransferase